MIYVFDLRTLAAYKSDFGSYWGRAVFNFLKKLVGNQYLELLVPLSISAKFRRNYLCSTD